MGVQKFIIKIRDFLGLFCDWWIKEQRKNKDYYQGNTEYPKNIQIMVHYPLQFIEHSRPLNGKQNSFPQGIAGMAQVKFIILSDTVNYFGNNIEIIVFMIY